MTTMHATLGGGVGVDTKKDMPNRIAPLPHYTTCQRCGKRFSRGDGPIAELLFHVARFHPCTCKTRTVRRCVGGRGKYEKYTLTLVCETHRATRCPECGSVLVNRRCPRCDA